MEELPEIAILYQSDPCLVVNKPAGLSTQAPPGIDSLEVRLRRLLANRKTVAGEVYLGIPHRLDRPASGAILFARRPLAAKRLARQFEKRRVAKCYWVLVEGHVQPPHGTWEDHLRKIPGVARAEVVQADHPEGRRAVLHYRVLDRRSWGSWLEVDLETGRTHQIRVQAASRGHPVLGDWQYGAQTPFGPQPDDLRLRAIALHARSLSFRHPRTGQIVSVTAPVWEAWELMGIRNAAD
ncbi:MAG TPA: RluA family pseudouridine synthase [Planctomycetaceae bacterium]|nr:RluA family pseudouridine synthase [Planctomycetaceae bacterium]HIQ22908.1 RluA family pseudouridine synthase [Planctomycetota bacterium]